MLNTFDPNDPKTLKQQKHALNPDSDRLAGSPGLAECQETESEMRHNPTTFVRQTVRQGRCNQKN